MSSLHPLYAIVDAETLSARKLALESYCVELRDAGVRLLQYRDKRGSSREILNATALISDIFVDSHATLILNDRADLALLAGFDGVHTGQSDLPPEAVRRLLGPGRIVGFSTHSEDEVREADAGAADYIAIGPVFPTGSKVNAEPVVGLEGVRRARALTRKPLVAIGGISSANAAAVLAAGADSIAVIGALLPTSDFNAGQRTEALLKVLGTA